MPLVVGRKRVRNRTIDITLDQNVEFSELLLSEPMQKGLQDAGFVKPSPIQLKAIPVGLMGTDLIAQAKSGTGKTLVFSVIALESVDNSLKVPQVLILAPTREIALQIHHTISTVSHHFQPPIKSLCLIGGIAISIDKQHLAAGYQIIIGTPGRVRELLSSELLNATSLRLFILDEADKLLETGFEEQIK